nr:MAG TPA: hypothetical protein [Caudoviricetes sp.]
MRSFVSSCVRLGEWPPETILRRAVQARRPVWPESQRPFQGLRRWYQHRLRHARRVVLTERKSFAASATVRPPNEVVQRDVEVVRQSDEHIIGRLSFAKFVLLDAALAGANVDGELLLGNAFSFSHLFEMLSKIKHDNASKRVLTRSIARAMILVQHVQLRVACE